MSWYIPGGEFSSLSDHELILVGWEDGDADLELPEKGRTTGWDIQALRDDEEKFEQASAEWKDFSKRRASLSTDCSIEELEGEITWLEGRLIHILDKHAKIIHITAYSKR